MPKYDTENFDPPAPVAYVSVRDPATGASLSNVPMLIDTGADVTLFPASYVEQLGMKPVRDVAYEIQGFDGEPNCSQFGSPFGLVGKRNVAREHDFACGSN
jgi:hypothetical protein